MEHPFGFSPLPMNLPNQISMFLQSRIIFGGFKTISPSPETVILKPGQDKPPTQIGIDEQSQNTRLGTRSTWKQKTYGYVLSRRAEVRNFTPVTSVRLRSRKQNQLPRTTRSNFLQNSEYIPKSMLDVSSWAMTTIPNCFLAGILQNHLPLTLMTTGMQWKLSSTIASLAGLGNF